MDLKPIIKPTPVGNKKHYVISPITRIMCNVRKGIGSRLLFALFLLSGIFRGWQGYKSTSRIWSDVQDGESAPCSISGKRAFP